MEKNWKTESVFATALVAAVCAMVAVAREPNYDESKVAPYTLEDPLTFADGRKLKRRQYRMWFKPDKSGPFIDWLLVLPNRVAELLRLRAGKHLEQNIGKG